ncbi:SAM-dependent methyltransferase [Chromobacterium phragmitis]|uniref:class I SAM-dependent methyltransferase n=1 Tax=Chromobacterium phragmitis TaxID=2202141 RepID=UPI000DECDFF9|nr:class I SAM-dependent methyltransferase [Chromobacterium phragmitis]AXE31487.1 SAM-dependent methyltransferase [Chromobacterium phragmitis]
MSWLRHPLLQLFACVGAWIFIAPAQHLLPWATLQAMLAGLFAIMLRMPGWQRLVHGLFIPGVALASQAGIAPGWYLAALLLTLALGKNALVERVPLYRSAPRVAESLGRLLDDGATVLEAGCGDGRLALQLAQRRPDVSVIALESAVGSCLLAKWRWLRAGRPSQLAIACRNFWKEDWGGYDAIYVFLSPEPMPRIWRKFVAEGRPGSLLISNTFAVPDVAPDESIPLEGPLQKELLIWRHPHGSR